MPSIVPSIIDIPQQLKSPLAKTHTTKPTPQDTQTTMDLKTASAIPPPQPLPTPPLETSKENPLQQNIHVSLPSFPVEVTLVPNKGRSYVATRTIAPGELIFVADAFGTTMCDPWLDCGICHYCWSSISNRKDQIKLPNNPQGPPDKKSARPKQETVMVFCNQECWNLYSPSVADMVCRVEQKVRRTWNDVVARHWTLKSRPILQTATRPAYREQIEEALSLADSKEKLLDLADNDLALFLNHFWAAVDSLIQEQESQLENDSGNNSRKPPSTQRAEALFPKLAKYLLSGDNNAHLAPKTSDDDCETTRLVTEIIMRSQHPESSTTQVHATFTDYCAMQSNELIILRQELKHEMDESDDSSAPSAEARKQHEVVKLDEPADSEHWHWRRLLSLVPAHLLSCLYVYLRLRDAFFLVSLDRTSNNLPLPFITIDHTTFRAILYREVANSFGIRDASDELLGFAVFPRASFFNHSCCPNMQKKRATGSPSKVQDGKEKQRVRQMEYWSTREIQAGEECCISYGDISKSHEERQQRLEEMYFFRCSCPRCIDEENHDANGVCI
ncbi:MAG: hypothetical protein BYD32DRAFT_410542 [Podila humilis]|nr:MAG: hypothetical protein BYD32DRAFT_410542 [Podila humilis]